MTSPLEGLHEFVSIVEAGSISAAARMLGVPRATLSRRLAALEASLGVRLLHRSTRRLVPTPAGDTLYQRGRHVLRDAQDTLTAVRRLDGVPRGVLRVSIPPGMAGTLVQPIFALYLERFPETTLEVEATSRHVDMVAEGIDVALRAGSVHDENLVGRTIWRSTLSIHGTPYYFAQHGYPKTPEDLRHHNCLVGYDRGASPQRRWPLRKGGGVPVSGRLASNELELVINTCLRGGGLALLPTALTRRFIDAHRLERVLEESVGGPTSLTLVYPSREFVDPKVRALIDLVVDGIATTFDDQIAARIAHLHLDNINLDDQQHATRLAEDP